MYSDILANLMKEIQTELPSPLVHHIYRVTQIALFLSKDWKEIKSQDIWIACLAHDRFRHLPVLEQLNLKSQWNLSTPNIPDYALHGYLAAHHLVKNYSLNDPAILKAVQNHTLLGPNPDLFSTLVFISDKLDFLKKHYQGADKIKKYLPQNHWGFVIEVAEIHKNRFDEAHIFLHNAIKTLKENIPC